jgi:hypothetical protein
MNKDDNRDDTTSQEDADLDLRAFDTELTDDKDDTM